MSNIPVIPDLGAAQLDVYPNNVADVMFNALRTGIPEIQLALRRPLRREDPSWTLSVFPVSWAPDTLEMGGTDPSFEPTDSTYSFQIQTLVKTTDEQDGRVWGAYLAKSVRLVLYRGPSFVVPLRQLKETRADGSVERYQRSGIKQQRFAANSLNNLFLQYSSTDYWVQTESF